MKALRIDRFKHGAKSLLNAVLGIISENLLVVLFMVAAFAACYIWWSVFK